MIMTISQRNDEGFTVRSVRFSHRSELYWQADRMGDYVWFIANVEKEGNIRIRTIPILKITAQIASLLIWKENFLREFPERLGVNQ